MDLRIRNLQHEHIKCVEGQTGHNDSHQGHNDSENDLSIATPHLSEPHTLHTICKTKPNNLLHSPTQKCHPDKTGGAEASSRLENTPNACSEYLLD